MMLDTPMVTATNFKVSAAPHNRSRYLSEAGIVKSVNSSCGRREKSVRGQGRQPHLNDPGLHQRRRDEHPGIEYT